jgi:hypothetical protein
MSHGELNLTVGKLPPIFNDCSISSLRKLIEDFACSQASGFNWQRESLCLLRARHPVCHIAWTNEHVGTSYDGLLMPPIMSAHRRETKEHAMRQSWLSPLITGPARYSNRAAPSGVNDKCSPDGFSDSAKEFRLSSSPD